uniref:Uncharacterized protein n=1 Tax=Tanacetum cinerariifolium TaxID=118510 RepID=A0A699SSX7_TANCI|nr:hypothetical protein [Tanacetum cinerariifolium]
MAKSLASHISSNGRSQFGAIKIEASVSFFLQSLESLDTIFGEHQWGILFWKMSHRSRDFGEILNESPVKTGVTEETSNTLDGCGMRQFSNHIDFGSVDLNLVFGNFMAEDNALFDHKVTFLPV